MIKSLNSKYFHTTIAIAVLTAFASCGPKEGKLTEYKGEEGIFEWQFPNLDQEKAWHHFNFDKETWWGTFPKDMVVPGRDADEEKNLRNDGLPEGEGTRYNPVPDEVFAEHPWAIGPVTKYEYNPVLRPTPGQWDKGRFGGGVHNGSIIVEDDVFYYIYRGEMPRETEPGDVIDYICDIGIAKSKDGIHFEKDYENTPFFRKGECAKYSYEDVNLIKKDGTYYLFCNQWLWENMDDYTQNGTFLAISKDLVHWEPKGIVFPGATRTHRNGVVLQNPHNEPVMVDGKYIMYLNYGLIAYSEDLIHWESKDTEGSWPGDEGCFALCNHDPSRPDDIILFTGGNHSGHFYAVGEVLLSKKAPEQPLDYLPAPVLQANPHYPYENGFTPEAPFTPISGYSDCIFFNGLTQHDGKWWFYYGGSEYYTCLATCPVN